MSLGQTWGYLTFLCFQFTVFVLCFSFEAVNFQLLIPACLLAAMLLCKLFHLKP